MKKAERLFQLVVLLRSKRSAVRAQDIAQQMHCSLRTVYRDIQDLCASGVGIQGEAGIGYCLSASAQLPTLSFTDEELLAILVGSRMVQAFTDPELAASAKRAEQKIRSQISEPLKQRCERQPYRIPITQYEQPLRLAHGKIRLACEQQHKVELLYVDEQGETSQRIIWPLGIIGLSGRWILVAWCEKRNDYRNFRFDRVVEMHISEQPFQTTPTINLTYYFKNVIQIDESNA
jgi:predicted DNA-binding transcriptional regulator YafY